MAEQKWYKNCNIAFERVKVSLRMCSCVNQEKAREKDNATRGKRSKRGRKCRNPGRSKTGRDEIIKKHIMP